MNYDFRTLNDKEFEVLASDLLSSSLGVHIERFKPGPDQGVDGRFFSTAGNEVILQYKHWVNSGLKKLVSYLRNTEVVSIRKLNPSRYILVTSLPLSRQDKMQIRRAIHPFIRMETDILGSEDLNDLLARNKDIERRHHKLWLSSISVLQAVLNSGIEGRSLAELEDIRAAIPLYVTTKNEARCLKKLESDRCLIITGEPGAGKTTLAKHLCHLHAAEGFAFYSVETDVSEAEAVFTPGTKQIFYFDDFLGRNYLTALGRQDSHVLNFMGRVSRDTTKRFVLTSRTNILNQGKNLSIAFSEKNLDKSEYEIRIDGLSTEEKAQMLYNHIWQKGLGVEYIDELYRDHRYRVIITHKSFNPRLVSFVTDHHKATQIPVDQYWDHVMVSLANPEAIWSHPYEVQLSDRQRDLVMCCVLNGGIVLEPDLKAAYSILGSDTGSSFYSDAKVVAGSMLTRVIYGSQKVQYGLFNPSIADFVTHRLSTNEKQIVRIVSSLRTVAALENLFYMLNGGIITRSTFSAIIATLLSSSFAIPSVPFDFKARLVLLVAAHREGHGSFDLISSAFMQEVSMMESLPVQSPYLPHLLAWAFEAGKPLPPPELLRSCTEEMMALVTTRADLLDVCRLVAPKPIPGTEGLVVQLTEAVVDFWESAIQDHIDENDLFAEFFGGGHGAFPHDELAELVDSLLEETNLNFTPEQGERIEAAVNIDAIAERNTERERHAEQQLDFWKEERSLRSDANSFVEDLFDRRGRAPDS